MGNENSTLGLSEETKAELRRSTEQLRQSEEKQQRRKAQAEEQKRAQAEVERRHREESFIATQLAEKERLEAVEKAAKAAKPRGRPKADIQRKARVSTEQAETETTAKQNLGADRPVEEAARAATPAHAVLKEVVDIMGEDAVRHKILVENEKLAAEKAATAKKRAEQEAKLKQRFNSMRERKSLHTAVEQPPASQGSEDGEIRETTLRSGTELALRGAASAIDTLQSRGVQDESTLSSSSSSSSSALHGWNARKQPLASQGSEEGEIRETTPRSGTELALRGAASAVDTLQLREVQHESTLSSSSSSSAFHGWNARKQPQAKSSSNSGDRPSSSSNGAVRRRDSKEPVVETQAQAADKVPASATRTSKSTPIDDISLSPKPSTGHKGESVSQGQNLTYWPTNPPAANKRPSISLGLGVASLPPKPPAALKKYGTSVEAAPKPAAGHKRSTPSGGFDMSNMPKIPKKNKQAVPSSASPRSPVQDDEQEARERLADVGELNWGGDRQPPEWYAKLKAITKRDAGRSNVQVLLERVKEKIGKMKKLPQQASAERNEAFNELREMIHKVFFIEVTPQLLRNLRMLHNNDGLPQIFDERYDGKVVWPYDLKADAEELYNKWCARTFEIDLLRGIKVGKPKNKGSADRLDPKFPKVPSNYYGNGRLLNGQWWPTQLTALRDGAHGSSQGGIYGEPGKGAYSVIMLGGVDKAGNKYPDVDEGDHVQYCGTDNDGPTKKPSGGTQRLIESYRLKTPVRLIRSSNADPAYAPEEGFRYDGLYEIIDVEHIDPADSKRQRHRFTLRRRPGQDPIRGSGPQKRPTQQELDAYRKDKTLRGYGAKG